MFKKILYGFLGLILILLIFTLYNSPSLVGLLPGGKDLPDKETIPIVFKSDPQVEITIPYTVSSDNPDLIKLKETFRLDTLVSPELSDYENVMKIQSWVHSRWKHDGANVPANNDPIYILQEAEKGERFRCVEYSLVASACLKSLGYIVRSLWLKTRDVDVVNRGAGHVANEIYLKDIDKWFFIDPQWDIQIIKNNIPLNAVEFQQAMMNKESIDIINPSQEISDEDYLKWIGPYLFYFTTSLNKGPITVWDRIVGTTKQLTLVPLDHDPPKYFQRLFRINNNIKTNSVSDFYPKVN